MGHTLLAADPADCGPQQIGTVTGGRETPRTDHVHEALLWQQGAERLVDDTPAMCLACPGAAQQRGPKRPGQERHVLLERDPCRDAFLADGSCQGQRLSPLAPSRAIACRR